MERFYIKQISAVGEKVEFSEITFQDGVNIVFGPSNSGKSYIIKCINFMFAGEIPFTKQSTGYDTVSMRMESAEGHAISMTRKIVDGKNGETGAGTVNVSSNIPGIESGDYSISKLEYSDLLLKLFGIKEHYSIIATEDYDVQNLTVRQMMHLFYIDEDFIFRSATVLDAPKYKKINASLAIIRFLLTGDDLMETVPKESKEERERKANQKAGVILYLNQKISDLTKRKSELEKKIAEGQDIDIEGKLAEIITRAEDVEKRIAKATSESRSLMKQIYEVSSKLEEARFLRERYEALESQYTSDLKRLRFIQDGEQKGGDIHKAVKCPFCDHDMSDVPDTKESFIETSSIEMAKVEYQLEDLAKVKDSNENKIQQLESMIEELNAQNEKMVEMIQKDLKPYAAQLRDQIATYQSVLDTRQELYAIDSMTAELNTNAWEKENDEDSDNPKFSGRQCISQKTWKELSDAFNQMVKDCGYPNRPESRINIDTVDAVVGSKFKKDEGKGYRAFLNTIMLFNLMKYLESNALFAPHILVLDSPILSLKEKKYKISEKEKATPGMRTSLFQYLVDHCGENQIIIAENEIPDDVDYKNAKLQEFTLEPGNGRYGFLKIRNRVVTAKHSRNGRE